jgi:hypothetical protein
VGGVGCVGLGWVGGVASHTGSGPLAGLDICRMGSKHERFWGGGGWVRRFTKRKSTQIQQTGPSSLGPSVRNVCTHDLGIYSVGESAGSRTRQLSRPAWKLCSRVSAGVVSLHPGCDRDPPGTPFTRRNKCPVLRASSAQENASRASFLCRYIMVTELRWELSKYGNVTDSTHLRTQTAGWQPGLVRGEVAREAAKVGWGVRVLSQDGVGVGSDTPSQSRQSVRFVARLLATPNALGTAVCRLR